MANDSYNTAERETVAFLAHEVDAEERAEAYAGMIKDHQYNAWGFRITGPSVSETICVASASTEAQLFGRYNERGDALKFADDVRAVFEQSSDMARRNLVEDGIVTYLRMMDEPEFGEETITTLAQGKPVQRPTTTVTIPLHIGFNTITE